MFSVFSFAKFLSCIDNTLSYQRAWCGVLDNVAILHFTDQMLSVTRIIMTCLLIKSS
jgi:hypothetical protein